MLTIRCAFALSLGTLTAAAPAALAQWTADPSVNTPVADAPGGQVLPKIAAVPSAVGVDAGFYVSWFDAANAYNVRLQRLLPDGREAFPHNGILISANPQNTSLVDYDLTADASGGAAVVFTDIRNGPDLDVYAYRVDASGSMLWGPNGVTISSNTAFEADPRIIQAAGGDFVVIWPRSDPADPGLFMQRLTPAGAKMLGTEGVRIAGDGTEYPAFAEMIPSDGGSTIVVYVRNTRTFASPRHVYAQKFDAAGTPLWNGGAPVILSSASVPIAHRPKVVSDGAGGAVFAWHDTRLSNVFNIWVQHVNAAGTQLFPAGGAQASTNAADRQHIDPALAYRAATQESFVFWNERNGAQSMWGISGQKFDAAGARQWTDSGSTLVPLNGVNKLLPRAVGYGDGAIVFWLDAPNTPLPGNRAIAMRVNAAGAPVWGGEGGTGQVVLSSTLSAKGRLPVALAPGGTAAIAFEDNRNDADDVFVQNVNGDGALGPIATPCPPDFDRSGEVNANDISSYLNGWYGDIIGGTIAADFDHSGETDANDISAFINAWYGAVVNGGAC